MSIKYVTSDEIFYDRCEVYFDLNNIEKHSISELQFILGKHRLRKDDYVKLAKKNIHLFREHNRSVNLYKLEQQKA